MLRKRAARLPYQAPSIFRLLADVGLDVADAEVVHDLRRLLARVFVPEQNSQGIVHDVGLQHEIDQHALQRWQILHLQERLHAIVGGQLLDRVSRATRWVRQLHTSLLQQHLELRGGPRGLRHLDDPLEHGAHRRVGNAQRLQRLLKARVPILRAELLLLFLLGGYLPGQRRLRLLHILLRSRDSLLPVANALRRACRVFLGLLHQPLPRFPACVGSRAELAPLLQQRAHLLLAGVRAGAAGAVRIRFVAAVAAVADVVAHAAGGKRLAQVHLCGPAAVVEAREAHARAGAGRTARLITAVRTVAEVVVHLRDRQLGPGVVQAAEYPRLHCHVIGTRESGVQWRAMDGVGATAGRQPARQEKRNARDCDHATSALSTSRRAPSAAASLGICAGIGGSIESDRMRNKVHSRSTFAARFGVEVEICGKKDPCRCAKSQ
eukprot:scaffold1402_cov254-Pinguiococcus_pyrenoidosus.AAC.2